MILYIGKVDISYLMKMVDSSIFPLAVENIDNVDNDILKKYYIKLGNCQFYIYESNMDNFKFDRVNLNDNIYNVLNTKLENNSIIIELDNGTIVNLNDEINKLM